MEGIEGIGGGVGCFGVGLSGVCEWVMGVGGRVGIVGGGE